MESGGGIGWRSFEKHKVALGDLVNHLFFPKHLPQSEEGHLVEIEEKILEYLSQVSEAILGRLSLSKIQRTIQTWIGLQTGRDKIDKILENLQTGESACLFVRKQNCTIQFTKLDQEFMRIITFRSSLPNNIVMGTCGSLKVTYPETVDIVPISPLLLSPCFTKQLEYLTFNLSPIAMPKTVKARIKHVETREPSFPYVVSEFLVQMLCPKHVPDQEREELESIKVHKKLRDQINWNDCALPFRRSGLWMSVKVILQMNLREEFNSQKEGNLMYKILLLKVFTRMAMEYNQTKNGSRWDTIAQILIKLARRAKKLSELETCANSELESQREEILKEVLSTIKIIESSVSKQWNEIASPKPLFQMTPKDSSGIRKIVHSKKNWNKDCIHKMENLTNYLNNERIPDSLKQDEVDNLKMIDPVIQTKGVNLTSLLDRYKKGLSTQRQDAHLNSLSIWIYQVEWLSRHGLVPNNDMQNCQQIFELLIAYVTTVYPLYCKTYRFDPVYFSRMIITVLQLVAVLDQIAVTEHPLLKSYKTGVEREMFDCLVIPEKCEMELVENLQQYFAQRNAHAEYGSWLETSNVETTSFPVKFAQQNLTMRTLKAKILQDSEEKMNEKRDEINRVKQECLVLQRQINDCSCSYTWNSYYERNDHDDNCRHCDLQTQLKNKRVSVYPYQRPLPPEEYRRDAVVFELIIPQEIAYLRDSISILLSEILGHTILSPKIGNIHTNWMNFKELNGYTHTNYQKFIHLGSQNKDTLSSHYGENPDVLTCSASSFILENGLKCEFFKQSCLKVERPSYHPCTFQIGDGNTTKKDAASYESLQFALNFKRSTENEAHSYQNKCHQNVKLIEFITFGSIRCGYKIQLRNLYAAMASQILALDKEPVSALIMQTIWELGPGKREIHIDFESGDMAPFSQEFLDLLSKLGEENATNWSNPMALLSLTVITVKILEMTESMKVKEYAAKILQRYRAILEGWGIKLESLISTSGDADKAEESELIGLLLKSAICSAFTFNVSSKENLSYIFKDPSDVTFWLKCLSRLHHLVVREDILKNSKNLSPFMRNLVRHARNAIPLNLQDHIYAVLEEDTWNIALHDFVCAKWQGARIDGKDDIPKFHHSGNRDPLKKHAFQGTYIICSGNSHHVVCVDILRGTFFVDGFPPSVIPESIIRTSLYQSFFRISKFRVQRDSRTFKTVDKYCGNDFEFTDTGGQLVIRQISLQGDGTYYELLPKELFQNQVANDLIDNFTHWFDSKTKVVYFRRLTVNKNIESDTDYLLISTGLPSHDLLMQQKWFLIKYNGIIPDIRSSDKNISFLLSINSNGFRKINRNLESLENKAYIHMILENDEDELRMVNFKICAKLWRLNLSFSLHQDDGLLYCDNYPGYYIPPTRSGGQSLGTLVGLKSGIVIEKRTLSEASGIKKLFIIQHGSVQISCEKYQKHQSTHVTEGSVKQGTATKGLRDPPYFEFGVDQILHRLRPGNSKAAWLYLALLHGATSSPFPDPFTQLTGTEMAMWILQSGFVWSCSPYDLECLETLEQIASMSPNYSYYPHHLKNMQTTTWPYGLLRNSYAAYDGYVIIVQRLLEDCSRLAKLFREV